MFNFLMPGDSFGRHVQRLAAQAQEGGGDLFDIARACKRIESGDKQAWEREWLALAEQTAAKARAALSAGHHTTAQQHFFCASQYYRMSDVFLGAPQEATKRERFRSAQSSFRAAAKLHRPLIEVISVRCGADEYDGYFCHPSVPHTGRMPAIFFMGGADSYAEEIYFNARPFKDRGCAVLIVDTPGRGSSMYLKRILTRPDYEVPGKACIDYLVSRPDVDDQRIGVVGLSMAGYYAPRVAAFDSRIKALVCWSGCYSLLDDLYDFYAELQPVIRRLLGGVDHERARELLKAYTNAGSARNILCPTLITHGGDDKSMSVAGARRLFAEIGAKDKTLRVYDRQDPGGQIHCSHDYWAHCVSFMADWMKEKLAANGSEE